MANNITDTKQKKARIIGKYSEASPDGTTFIQTETESADGVVTVQEYVLLDDGSHFDSAKLHLDRFSGKLVSTDSMKDCWKCGNKVYVESAKKIGDSYLCPGCKVRGAIGLFIQALWRAFQARKED